MAMPSPTCTKAAKYWHPSKPNIASLAEMLHAVALLLELLFTCPDAVYN
jgi:hypothetical protein